MFGVGTDRGELDRAGQKRKIVVDGVGDRSQNPVDDRQLLVEVLVVDDQSSGHLGLRFRIERTNRGRIRPDAVLNFYIRWLTRRSSLLDSAAIRNTVESA